VKKASGVVEEEPVVDPVVEAAWVLLVLFLFFLQAKNIKMNTPVRAINEAAFFMCFFCKVVLFTDGAT